MWKSTLDVVDQEGNPNLRPPAKHNDLSTAHYSKVNLSAAFIAMSTDYENKVNSVFLIKYICRCAALGRRMHTNTIKYHLNS